MKKVFILGATGSIGDSTLHCLSTINATRSFKHQFKIVGISFNDSFSKAEKIITKFSIKNVIAPNEKNYFKIKKKFPQSKVYWDFSKGLEENDFDILINGLSGSIGLKPTVVAIKKKARILLANKETLVIAGEIINRLLKKYRTEIIPLDSEHAAIFQLLFKKNINQNSLKKIILTASGGPFLKKKKKNPSLKEALKHPNWKMGKKITIDSATMMNKGLEVIEAHFLFNLPYEKIDVIVHPESIIHSFIVGIDNTYYAQMGSPDMKHPIYNGLTHPEIIANDLSPYNLSDKKLTFHKVDYKRFPLLSLAYECGRKGGSYLTVMNAANEAAVHLFLKEKIQYQDIYKLVSQKVRNHKPINSLTIEKVIALDKEIKRELEEEFKN